LQSWNQIGYRDSQTNLEIARDTRQDSNQMRSIAFLTMFFLPATFIAVRELSSSVTGCWNCVEGGTDPATVALLHELLQLERA
jgi:hypothetical protein